MEKAKNNTTFRKKFSISVYVFAFLLFVFVGAVTGVYLHSRLGNEAYGGGVELVLRNAMSIYCVLSALVSAVLCFTAVRGVRKLYRNYVVEEERKKALLEDRVMLEEAYQAASRDNEAKSDFLSRMSHDIRTPMNAIMGMTAIAGANLEDKDKVADCLHKISVSNSHLLGLINEILDMSKIEAGKMNLLEEEFDIVELVKRFLAISEPQIEEKGHELTVSLEEIKHKDVIGDIQRIQQVYMNLMSNAIKYTQEAGKISFTVYEKPCDRAGYGCYVFVIKDNGIGMSKEFLEGIYETFSRTDDVVTKQMQGTGLGMAIARNIVHLMDGDINIESESGEGTTAEATMYLRLQEHGKDGVAKGSAGAVSENGTDDMVSGEGTGILYGTGSIDGAVGGDGTRQTVYDTFSSEDYSGRRVLLVEDNKLSAEITDEIFSMAKLEVDHADNGREAVDIMAEAESGYYDIIFMDIEMPELNGYEATKAIRSLGGYAGRVPIIAMSANAFAEEVKEAMDAGMDGHIAKPLDFDRLIKILKKWIG